MIRRLIRRTNQYVERTAGIRRAARDTYGVAWLPLQLKAMRIRQRYGWGLDESLASGLLDPESSIDLDATASPRETTRLQYLMNAHQIEAVSEDKVVFHMIANAAGLPIPRQYLTLMDGAMGWDHVHSRPIAPDSWAMPFRGLPDHVIAKPSAGSFGKGVRALERVGEVWRDVATGRLHSARDIVEQMRDDEEYPDWIVQERLGNHHDLDVFESPGLHTLRLVTFVNAHGRVEILWSGFRIASAGSAIDNFHGGRLGNMTCEIDLSTGRVEAAYAPLGDRPGVKRIARHPARGVDLDGFQLPWWADACEVVTRAAPLFAPLRTLGFDLALCEDGPRIVEINMWWDVPQVAPVRAILDRLWHEQPLASVPTNVAEATADVVQLRGNGRIGR